MKNIEKKLFAGPKKTKKIACKHDMSKKSSLHFEKKNVCKGA